MKKGCKYGSHRVIEPKGVLPQVCWRLDNNMDQIYDNEILVDVDRLNLDAASFKQIRQQAQDDEEQIKQIILNTISERGKQHNPVTGSGGMFIGTVQMLGESLKGKVDVQPGDRIASLVSLSLTPLKINKIKEVMKDIDQLEVKAQAILFERTIFAKLPENVNEALVTALLDVAGAPARTARLVKAGDSVLIIGASGKSGLLSSYVARKMAGDSGLIVGTGHSEQSTKRLRDAGFCHYTVQADATNPLDLEAKVAELTKGKMVDVTINCASVPDTELGSILATKQDGVIYFFNMATNFNKAALGAEGVASEVTMIIGNGYVEDHAAFALNLLKESHRIRSIFERTFGPYYQVTR